MKNLFIDCGMGAAGDMLSAAILELFSDRESKVEELNNLNIPEVEFEIEDSFKCGIKGSRLLVKINGEEEKTYDYKHCHGEKESHSHDGDHSHCNDEGHSHNQCHSYSHDGIHTHNHSHSHDHIHRGIKEIEEIVNNIRVSEKVKNDILSVYKEIAIAESISHNVDVSEIHFHEVGAMDAIADISAFCYLLDLLKVDKIISSPIHVGKGHVHCAHGILPVPAPATAYILKDIPIYSSRIEGELCTPTGAAILKNFVDEFGDMPNMKVNKIGYGMGKKDFEIANCVRAFLGEGENVEEIVYELSFNVDDMTGEDISFAMDRLFDYGALEVYTIAIGMKKSRPGNLIRVMCKEDKRKGIVDAIFKYTTTIGIREISTNRYVLKREIEEISTSLGKIRRKKSYGYGVERKKYEYDDISKIARDKNLSLDELRKILDKEV